MALISRTGAGGGRTIPEGGRRMGSHGKWEVKLPTHPRARSNGYVFEHILIAERALGKPLPKKAVVHHYGDASDNSRLVVSEDQAFHLHLHRHQRALAVSGNADWLLCPICGQYDSPENLYVHRGARKTQARHRACHAQVARARRKESA